MRRGAQARKTPAGAKEKTLETVKLQGFFMVDDTGLEPVTSRTSTLVFDFF